MRDDTIFAQIDTVLVEQMDDDLLLYNPQTAATLHLNNSSALVWHLCDGQRSLEQIISTLEESYPPQAGQIRNDVLTAMQEMHEQGVLQQVSQKQE